MADERPLPVRWEHYPPDGELAYVPIVTPAPRQTIRGWILSSPLVGLYVHWDGQLSRPCLASDDPTWPHCPGCVAQWPRRWKGYVGCWEDGVCRRILMEISSNAARACPQLCDREKDLRGYLLETYRDGRHKNAPVVARVASMRLRADLPEPFSVESALLRLWGENPYLVTPVLPQADAEEDYPWGTGDPDEQERRPS